MCIGGDIGIAVPQSLLLSDAAFGEPRGTYLVELAESAGVEQMQSRLAGIAQVIDAGVTQREPTLTLTGANRATFDISLKDLSAAWYGTLDW